MGSNIEMNDAAPVVSKHDKAVAQSKTHRGNHEEVDRGDVGHVVFQEGSPGLRRGLAMTSHVFRDRRLRGRVSEQSQLGLDPRRAPDWILKRHAPDELC